MPTKYKVFYTYVYVAQEDEESRTSTIYVTTFNTMDEAQHYIDHASRNMDHSQEYYTIQPTEE